MRKTVTLFIPPYLFKRKKKALNIGKKATFECISCAKNDVKTYAKAIKEENENGEYHELVQWPNDHDCAPSATMIMCVQNKDVLKVLLVILNHII